MRCSKKQHGIAEGEEAVLLLNSDFIRLADEVAPGEGGDEHEQSGTGQVEVGNKGVYGHEAVARVDIQVGTALNCHDGSPGADVGLGPADILQAA